MIYFKLGLIILAVVIGAVADGFNDKNKNLGHLFQPLEKPMLIIIGILSGWIGIISYIAFRVALFDYARNLAAGQKLLYIGDVGYWDKFLKKQQPFGIIFGRVIFLTLGIFVTLHYG